MNKCTHEQEFIYDRIGGAFHVNGYSYEHGFIGAPPVKSIVCNLIAYNVSYPLSGIYEHMNNWTYEIGGAARGVPF